MKIYTIEPDVNNYQYFMLNNDELALTDMMHFYGTSKSLDTWSSPEVFIYQPKLLKGNFSHLWGTEGIVIDQYAYDVLLDILEMSCQLLPLYHDNEKYYIMNVTGCYNCLDEMKTRWRYGIGRMPIDKHVFYKDRFAEDTIFKAPSTSKFDTYVTLGMKNTNVEFLGRVISEGLTGLEYEEIWNSD